jgi:hypothetical protein
MVLDSSMLCKLFLLDLSIEKVQKDKQRSTKHTHKTRPNKGVGIAQHKEDIITIIIIIIIKR